jgi:ketosteroid isomerase-like protein
MWGKKAIERVARLQHDLLAGLDLQHRLHVWMPPVVSGPRFLAEMFPAIDGDAPGRRAHGRGRHAPCSSRVDSRYRHSKYLPREANKRQPADTLDRTMPPRTLEDIARDFLLEMQACVRAVDYERAHALFAEDVVAFGTFATVVIGRDHLEREQWRNVWPTISDFTFRLTELHCLGTPEAICVIVPWDSVGQSSDGQAFSRPGRATLLLSPRGDRWVATHSHFSLAPTPAT